MEPLTCSVCGLRYGITDFFAEILATTDFEPATWVCKNCQDEKVEDPWADRIAREIKYWIDRLSETYPHVNHAHVMAILSARLQAGRYTKWDIDQQRGWAKLVDAVYRELEEASGRRQWSDRLQTEKRKISRVTRVRNHLANVTQDGKRTDVMYVELEDLLS